MTQPILSLDPGQEQALKAVQEWYSNSDQSVFRLFGYAGTGKTTIAIAIANLVGSNVLFAAYTGKAAYVLQSKGCSGATTIHSLIYKPAGDNSKIIKETEIKLMQILKELDDDQVTPEEAENHPHVISLKKKLKELIEVGSKPKFMKNDESKVRGANLVIIDECSMVDSNMGADLVSFGTKILVLGDPGQLPPVKGQGYFTENVKADFMLEKVHRQAKDNPILHLATLARLGEPIPMGTYGESTVLEARDAPQSAYLECNQLLVGKNATRDKFNARIRHLLGFQNKYPEENDKVVCLRNNHNLGLLNGSQWKVTDVGQTDPERIIFSISPELSGAAMECLEIHAHHFLGTQDKLPWWEASEAEHFDYGYALTCHKAQGSQWKDVTVYNESNVFRKDRNKWLYTAITRAAEKLTLIRP